MQDEQPICWIDTISEQRADEPLRRIYDAVRGPSGRVDNLYRAFSLRPHVIAPADDLYRAVLHHDDNRLPKRFSELLGCWVAALSGCGYALAHHGHNFARLDGDPERAEAVLRALKDGRPDDCGDLREAAALRYAERLCLEPGAVGADDIAALKTRGWDDGEILEIVQVVAAFSYFARVINALGVELRGERIGLY